MRYLPRWVDGGLFGFFFVPLILLLKIACPLSVGCFSDPFLIPLFSPLFLLEHSIGLEKVEARDEIFFIMFFWGLVVALCAHLFDKISARGQVKE